MENIHQIRKDYTLKTLDESEVAADPFSQFAEWFQEALDSKVLEANAMVLSTVGETGFPSSRVVLLKGVREGGLVFFTNYNSRKGSEIEKNPKASLVFFWPELERQVRFIGTVSKIPGLESDLYFSSRPENSKVGAWASPQSQVIPNRKWLEERESIFKKTFESNEISRPDFWGGYELKPHEVEFWQGRPSRLHDRILYQLSSDSSWGKVRLAP